MEEQTTELPVSVIRFQYGSKKFQYVVGDPLPVFDFDPSIASVVYKENPPIFSTQAAMEAYLQNWSEGKPKGAVLSYVCVVPSTDSDPVEWEFP